MVTTQQHRLLFQFHNPRIFRIYSLPPQTNPKFKFLTTTRNNKCRRCRCTSSGGRRESGSRWYSDDDDDPIPTKPFDYDDDDGGDFGFKSATTNNKRNWWSGDGDDDEEEDEEDEFGVLEDSINGIAWFTKVIKAFGWMVPAIMISMIVGTGPNAFFMALALPLAQTAFSLVVDTFWAKPKRYKPRTYRRRPFARAASNVKEKERTAGNKDSFKKGERTSSKFGGWDELDEQGRTDRDPFVNQNRNAKEKSQPKEGKLSRMVRKRERPFVLRLLIAVFPFLGSWTRFL